MNSVFYWTMYDAIYQTWIGDDPRVHYNFDKLEPLAKDPEVLLNHLDILFTYGMLTDETREIIKQSLEGLYWSEYKENRARLALYLMLVSPDFTISK